ncbi:MAG TPA: peptidoglycan-binding protein, partial [Kofleriaceae bacterium]|nr:peptidoglycan-binding protein [Kofleriaceae bacterium]
MTVEYKPKQPVSVPIGKQSTVELPPRAFRLRLACMLFDVDKVFLLPGAMHDIRVLKTIYDQHPGVKVLVTGHCDTQAPKDYNQYLSDERAESIAAFLQDDVDVWLKHYQGTPHSKTWGTKEDQYMLKTLPEGQPPYYAGEVDGVAGPGTQAAIKRFQQEHGLKEDGFAGPDTRRALVKDYMALDGTTLPAGTEIQKHGCGEYHLAVPTADEVDEQKNRRVEVFFFEKEITPPPRAQCNDCPEYDQWVEATHETINLCEDAGWLDVLVMDAGGTPVKNAKVFAEGTLTFVDFTNDQGQLRFPALPPGPYDCRVVVDGVDPCKFPVTVTAGSPPAAPPSVPSDPPATAP